MTQPQFPSAESAPSMPALKGVEHAGVIDALVHDPETDVVTLLMVEPRPWDGSELRLFQLQEKINAYLSFALDGEMHEAYPQLEGKPLRLLLDCMTAPDSTSLGFLGMVRDQIAFQGIALEVRAAAPASGDAAAGGGCGHGCGCQ
jgi:hypothetical protein